MDIHPAPVRFTIPKKKPKIEQEDKKNLSNAPIFTPIDNSTSNYAKYISIVYSRFSNSSPVLKNQLLVSNIEEIRNEWLRQKHEDYKKSAFGLNAPKEQYVFLAVPSKAEIKRITTHGLQVNNSYYSDLGLNSEGVYVFRHPDLMVAHPFFKGHTVHGICFKMAVINTNWVKVGPGSRDFHPTPNNVAHSAKISSMSISQSRLDKHKDDQLYVYDLTSGKPSDIPRCILPIFMFSLNVNIKGDIPLNLMEIFRPELHQTKVLHWKSPEGILANEELNLLALAADVPKPSALTNELFFKDYIDLEDFHTHPAISLLFRRSNWGNLTNFPGEFRVIDDEGQTLYSPMAMILTGKKGCQNTKLKNIVKKCRQEKVGLYASLEDVSVFKEREYCYPTEIFCIPPSEITTRLGLPYLPRTDDYLYCIFIKSCSFEMVLDKTNYQHNLDTMQKTQCKMPFHSEVGNFIDTCHYMYESHLKSYHITNENIELNASHFSGNEMNIKESLKMGREYFEVICSTDDPNYPTKGILSKNVRLNRSGEKKDNGKRVTWAEGDRLEQYSDNIPRSQSRWHDHSSDLGRMTEFQRHVKESSKGEAKNTLLHFDPEALTDEQKKEGQRWTNAFRDALSSETSSSREMELLPLQLPMEEVDEKARKAYEKKKNIISSLPLPKIPGIIQSSTIEKDTSMDIEIDSSYEENMDPVLNKESPQYEDEEDPATIDYDQRLLGRLEIEKKEVEQESEDMEIDTNSQDSITTSSSSIMEIPAAPASTVLPSTSKHFLLSNDVLKIVQQLVTKKEEEVEEEQKPKMTEEIPDTPASPEGPASPPKQPDLTEVQGILQKLGKNVGLPSGDVDLRVSAGSIWPLLTETKIIPLTGKVQFNVPTSNQLQKSNIEVFTIDSDDEEEKNKKEDKDWRQIRQDKDERRKDVDKKERDRDDRGSIDRDDRDYRRRNNERKDRDDRRKGRRRSSSREGRKSNDQGFGDRSANKRRNYRERITDRGQESGWEQNAVLLPQDLQNRFISVLAPVNQDEIFLSPIASSSSVDLSYPPPPLSPPSGRGNGPSSPDDILNLDRSCKFVKPIPLTESKHGSTPIVPHIPITRDETWRRLGFSTPVAPGLVVMPKLGHSQLSIARASPTSPIFPNLSIPPPGLFNPPILPNVSIPPPNIIIQQPVLNQTYMCGMANESRSPPKLKPPFPLKKVQKPDCIVILVNDFIVKQTMNVHHIEKLFQKLLEYKKSTHIPVSLHVHDSCMATLTNSGLNKQMVKSVMEIFEKYQKEGIFKRVRVHDCDRKGVKEATQVKKCILHQAEQMAGTYPNLKVIYYTLLTEDFSVTADLQQYGINVLDQNNIMSFDTI